ncbi:hypothetical protein Ana3638_19720 [Anaerocolumna sedimenticola]|uniref:Uncharacterized protein n=1 Tax=Anaerocolumna sedimenticola TaxID=2696063 RepID=A0A6P1TR51_9FIRM|nr:hypothetical protein [Anaerocolumna sedimenticola]QHQ62729.1 hypothetical protein Ana3638_19720 [Anaerocolumna sedimenticola]
MQQPLFAFFYLVLLAIGAFASYSFPGGNMAAGELSEIELDMSMESSFPI